MSDISKCELYRFFYADEILSYLFAGKTINRNICKKAQFYFEDLCLKCEINPTKERG
jgi:hypothetical protein